MPESPIQPGFMVLHGNRLEDLRQVTLDWMEATPLHPMERTTFLVQSNGIAQWLKTRIAEGREDGRGVCMAADVMLPARFQWIAYRRVVEAAEGMGSVPTTSPFDKTRLRWRLMNLLPARIADDDFAALAHFLGDDADQRKRYQLAERLADLFDQYQVYRADWLAAWADGHDVLTSPDGNTRELPDDQRWQPQLWRDIMASLPEEERTNNRAAIHQRFLQAAQALTPETRPAGLPRRLVVFGISSLPHQVLEALSALSGVTQVILAALNPCQHHWGDIIEHKELLRAEYRRQPRKPGIPQDLSLDDMHLHVHPLLAAWGKQGRDYLHLLAEHDDTEGYVEAFEAIQHRIDVFTPPDTSTLLGQLQDDVLDLRPVAETRERWPAVNPGTDSSIAFHVAHSSQRELEILHDQLLAAFDADDTLQPRDIIVMVPDVNEFAPHIHAVFGQYDRRDSRHIPYQVVDQRQRHREPLMVAMEMLLSLPRLRFRASELLDLIEVPAVRSRFGIEEADLPTLQRWIRGANIHWGIDARQRATLDLPEHDELHTWRFGLSRMLMGYAVGEPVEEKGDWEGIVPYDEVAGLDAALVGPLYRLVAALDHYRDAFTATLPPPEWAELLQCLLNDMLAPSTPREEALLGQLQEALEAWMDECHDAGFSDPLSLTIVRESWLSRIDEPQLSQRFLGGSVTFATLMPMRAIPYRHVCLLGMNDGQYPRRADIMDFDLMAGRSQYRPGDRSRREDDRYLFLEAMLSARDRIYISWAGRSLQDNSPCPASVLVGQLRDHLAAGWRLAGISDSESGGESLINALTTEHPLQPFSEAYFRRDTGFFTYAREWAGVHGEDAEGASEEAGLPLWVPESEISLRQLGDFLRDPVTAFYRQRLKVYVRREDTTSEDDEPFGFEGLARWQEQDALLQPVAQKMTSDLSLNVEEELERRLGQRQRAGAYPPAPVGPGVREHLTEGLPGTLERYRELLKTFPEGVSPLPEIDLSVGLTAEALGYSPSEGDTLPSERVTLRLKDILDNVRQDAKGSLARIVITTSRGHKGKSLHWANLIRHWPAHLALQVVAPGAVTRLVTPSGTMEMNPIEPGEAQTLLESLATRWIAGMQHVTPTHAVFAFPLLQHEVWSWADTGNVSKLRSELETEYEREQERSPMFVREFPELEELIDHPDFESASHELYGPLYQHMIPAKEDDQ